MKVTLLAAVAANRVIGKDNRLPWRLPPDLRRFKELTWGHTLVMGRKTFESIGRPLPGRGTVVLTRQAGYAPEGARVARSLEEALDVARGLEGDGGEVFVVGGAEVYRQALPAADRLQLTLIEEDFTGDAYFPEYDESEWRLTAREDHEPAGDTPFAWSFRTFERHSRPGAG